MSLTNEIIFVSGQRGSGKSFWTKKYSLSLPRCVIYDSLGEYHADRRLYNIDELIQFFIDDEKDPELFRIAYDSVDDGDISTFCRAVLARGNMYLIIEEIDLFCQPLRTDQHLKRLIKYGRHYGVQIIGVSRKPSEVSRDFTSNATRFITFLNREPLTIKYFRSIFGDHALEIPKLQKFHYLDVDFSKGEGTFDVKKPIDANGRKDPSCDTGGSSEPPDEHGDEAIYGAGKFVCDGGE